MEESLGCKAGRLRLGMVMHGGASLSTNHARVTVERENILLQLCLRTSTAFTILYNSILTPVVHNATPPSFSRVFSSLVLQLSPPSSVSILCFLCPSSREFRPQRHH